MTGENFSGKEAFELGVVTKAVPRAELRQRTIDVAKTLMNKSPTALRQTKIAFKYSAEMTWDEAAEYLLAKNDQAVHIDPERSREKGMTQFLDQKSYRPGVGSFKRDS
jgi:feruloyl-CoA hydratase/lyase